MMGLPLTAGARLTTGDSPVSSHGPWRGRPRRMRMGVDHKMLWFGRFTSQRGNWSACPARFNVQNRRR